MQNIKHLVFAGRNDISYYRGVWTKGEQFCCEYFLQFTQKLVVCELLLYSTQPVPILSMFLWFVFTHININMELIVFIVFALTFLE